jgi:hypothetical protein
MKFRLEAILGSALSIVVHQQAPATKHARSWYAIVSGVRLWYEAEARGEPFIMSSGGEADLESAKAYHCCTTH